MIAQDIEKVHPEFVLKTGEEDYITYKDPGFKYVLIKAIQEQQSQIANLKSQNTELKKRIESLEANSP